MTRLDKIETLFNYYHQGFLYTSYLGYCLLETTTNHYIGFDFVETKNFAPRILRLDISIFYGLSTMEPLEESDLPPGFYFYSNNYKEQNIFRHWIEI